jgi:hypothetical protein
MVVSLRLFGCSAVLRTPMPNIFFLPLRTTIIVFVDVFNPVPFCKFFQFCSSYILYLL